MQGKIHKGGIKQPATMKEITLAGNLVQSWAGGGGEGAGKCSRAMSGGKPVFVSVMYSTKARMRWGSVHNILSH